MVAQHHKAYTTVSMLTEVSSRPLFSLCMWLVRASLLLFYIAKIWSNCWVRGPYLVVKNFVQPFKFFPWKQVKPKIQLVDSSYVTAFYLDFLFFFLVKSPFSEIRLETHVGLCTSTSSLSNCWVLDVGVAMSDLLLPNKLLRLPKVFEKCYTCSI